MGEVRRACAGRRGQCVRRRSSSQLPRLHLEGLTLCRPGELNHKRWPALAGWFQKGSGAGGLRRLSRMGGPPSDEQSCIVCNRTSDLVILPESSSSPQPDSLQSIEAP